MSYGGLMTLQVEGWEGRNGGAYVLLEGQLVLATDEVLREVAHSVMLRSRERDIEMHREKRELAHADDDLPPVA